MALSDTILTLEQQHARILANVAEIGNLRPGFVRKVRTKCGRADRWLLRASDDLARAGRAAARACEQLGSRLRLDREELPADCECIRQALEAMRPRPIRKGWEPPRRDRVGKLLPSFPPRGSRRRARPMGLLQEARSERSGRLFLLR